MESKLKNPKSSESEDTKEKSKTFLLIEKTKLIYTICLLFLIVGAFGISEQSVYAQLLNPCPYDPTLDCTVPDDEVQMPGINAPTGLTQEQNTQDQSDYNGYLDQYCKDAAKIEALNTFASCPTSFEPTNTRENEAHGGVDVEVASAGGSAKEIRDPGARYGNAGVLCQPRSDQAYEREYQECMSDFPFYQKPDYLTAESPFPKPVPAQECADNLPVPTFYKWCRDPTTDDDYSLIWVGPE